MKIKKHLTKKNIIIFSIILTAMLLITILMVYLVSNTIIFKSDEEVKDDLLEIQDNIKEGNNKKIDNKLYNKDVGVSGETLYIKENASDKLKESAQGTEIGFEKSTKSENGMIIVDAYKGTSAIEYTVVSHTKDILNIETYSYNNLCALSYQAGSIKDKKLIEDGKDELKKNMIAPNTTYTLASDIEEGVNTAFFLDSDSKYISSTTEKTFTTPENARYIKIITEGVENYSIRYSLVLGTEPSYRFDTNTIYTSINTNENIKNRLPFTTDKTVVYIDGGEIELKYVSK